jgi:peptide deformylase
MAFEDLKIVLWPDPRLRKMSVDVEQFDDNLRTLVARMLELMRQSKGVGLAAPQVGLNIRLFVMNATGQPGDDRVYVNPILTEATGEEASEEGCLSLPQINAEILRHRTLHMEAKNLDGQPIAETETGYVARIWQHEFDHLNGTLILDRMGEQARIGCRKILRELEERYETENPKKLVKTTKSKR